MNRPSLPRPGRRPIATLSKRAEYATSPTRFDFTLVPRTGAAPVFSIDVLRNGGRIGKLRFDDGELEVLERAIAIARKEIEVWNAEHTCEELEALEAEDDAPMGGRGIR